MSRYRRKSEIRSEKRFFVISVEGEVDEKEYFEALIKREFGCHLNEVKVWIIPAQDGESSPQYVLDRLDTKVKEFALDGEDIKWLVVDTDRWQRILPGISQQCRQKGYRLCVSNPCFELWLYLHLLELSDLNHSIKSLGPDITKSKLRRSMDSIRQERYKSPQYAGYHMHLSYGGLKKAETNAEQLDVNKAEGYPNSIGTRVYLVTRDLLDFIKQQGEPKFSES